MIEFFHHLFFPHTRNNHRARLLHNSTLFIISLFLLSSSFLSINIKRIHPDVLGISYSISENELIDLTNRERAGHNLPALTQNSTLDQAAAQKAANMFEKNYWAHFAPDGTSPWYFFKNVGYNYLYAGENLAKGFTSSGDVVRAWMVSPSHRENILSDKYNEIGFAIVEGSLQGEDTVLVVQLFGSTQNVTSETNENKLTQTQQAVPAQQVPLKQPQIVSSQESSEAVNNPIPTVAPQKKQAIVGEKSSVQPKVNLPSTTKNISLLLFSILAAVLALDVIIVERRKIPRLIGHNLDHIILIGVFLLFILIGKTGGIL